MVAATTPTPQEALVAHAKARGFLEVRQTATHWFIKKGTANFKIPKRESVNEYTRSAINKICVEVDQRANRSKGSQSLLPLAVNYQNETWAVVSKNATEFNIQSLENGTRKWVDKNDVQIVTDEELRAMPGDDEVTVAQAEAALPPAPGGPKLTVHSNGASVPPPPTAQANHDDEPAPPPRSTLDQLEELDPMAYWRRMTQRQIDNYEGQIAEAMAKIQPIVERRDALIAALEAAGGKTISGSATRRVQLPPSAPGRRPGAAPKTTGQGVGKRYPPEKIAEVKRLIDQGKDNPTISAATGVAASTVSYYRSKK